MRIAVIHGIGFFYSGGGEKLVIQQVLGLRARGHEVECLAPVVDPARSFPGLLERVRARRLAPALPRSLPYADAFALLIASLAAPRLARHLARFDVVLAANQPAPWIAWWAHRLSGVPYVIYLNQPNRLLHPRPIDEQQTIIVKHDYVLLRSLAVLGGGALDLADRVSVRDAHVALGNGEYMTRILTKVYRRGFASCPGGAALIPSEGERANGGVRVNGRFVRKPFVLLTNRHYPQKMFEIAFDALRHPELARREVQLVITGQPTAYTAKLKRDLMGDPLRERVLFVGLTNEADLARLYAGAACYVYTSPEEDYGMGVVEAMAAATPVVAWARAGPTGTVVDGVTGFLVEPGANAEFAERVAQLVLDDDLRRRIGEAAVEHVRANLSIERHLDRLEEALAASVRCAS